MIESEKLFSNKHAVFNSQSVRQTSLKVGATWVTSVHASPDVVLVPILTGIHHSAGKITGCRNQHYIILQQTGLKNILKFHISRTNCLLSHYADRNGWCF